MDGGRRSAPEGVQLVRRLRAAHHRPAAVVAALQGNSSQRRQGNNGLRTIFQYLKLHNSVEQLSRPNLDRGTWLR